MSSNVVARPAPTLQDRAAQLVERAKRVIEAASAEPPARTTPDDDLAIARELAAARERARENAVSSAQKIIAEAEARAELIDRAASRQAAATLSAARHAGQRIIDEARVQATTIEARERGGLSFSSLWIEAGEQPEPASAEDFFAGIDNDSIDIFRR